MIRIAITPPAILPEEGSMIETILSHGWDFVHLRHPSASRREVRAILESVSQSCHRKIRLHGHFDLLNEFNLGGVHLNSRCPLAPAGYVGSVSRSCHSVSEVNESKGCDYVTLSPVFDSVSKHGYKGAGFDFASLKKPEGMKLIALGGLTSERLPLLDCSVFDGYAVLGGLFGELPADWLPELTASLRKFDK